MKNNTTPKDEMRFPAFKSFVVIDESMSYEGRLSIDPGDDILSARMDLADFMTERFTDRDVYVLFTAAGVELCRVVSVDAEIGLVAATFYNPDKQRFADRTYNMSEIQAVYRVMKIGKFRESAVSHESPH
jgi:hypothetical protein